MLAHFTAEALLGCSRKRRPVLNIKATGSCVVLLQPVTTLSVVAECHAPLTAQHVGIHSYTKTVLLPRQPAAC